MTRSTRKPAAYAALAVALLAALALAPGHTPRAGAGPCPPGYSPLRLDRSGPTWVTRLQEATDDSAPAPGCARDNRPESVHDLDRANAEMTMRETGPFTSVRAGAREAATRQAAALAGSGIAGTTGSWTPVGTGPLLANDTDFPRIVGEGLAELAGRIQDFAYDDRPGKDIVYVATAQGGVWRSLDRGGHWTSISDTLPNLITGSVAWSPAGGGPGTLVVVTGDSNGGGNSYTGTGVYRSVDGGASWQHATGVPSGLLGFRVAVDPTNPSEFYAATGGGLFRSTDAGKTFVNVNLPTGSCAGKPAAHPCFFANQVTDVVVQSPDTFGHAGGKVVAVVGWRAGAHPDADGHPEAPGNGLYGSDTGAPDTFTRLDQPGDGFAAQAQIGRTELGAATGKKQDHNYLYAVVEDAAKFNSGVPVTDANEAPAPVLGVTHVLAGIYVSADFGQTWKIMVDGDELSDSAVAEGSALGGTAQAQMYSPGVQAWYNEWIKPDPSRTDTTAVPGAPTRLMFGLEEVWRNRVNAPMVGPTSFVVVGRYFAGDTCFFLNLPGVPYCPPYTGEPQGGTTTHPDQHGAIFLPGPGEGVTLLVGNDGGVYKQVDKGGEDFTNQRWGNGANTGFHTLLPYGVAVAKDGVVYAGLQDNGHLRIEPYGKQIETFGGDGTWALTDPDDSDVAYEATPGASMNVSTDGGRTWRAIDPSVTAGQFVAQFAMDPKDAAHIGVGGEEVMEATNAPQTTWKTVFDLGTVDNPGKAPDPTDTSTPNRVSAIDINGNATYVGWCGTCDVITQGGTFKAGIATNVGGDQPGEAGSSAGWHLAAAEGLPQRFITSVHVDPDNPRTVYVTLGGYGRVWVPPGVNGDAADKVGTGHVYKSTDAGEHFTDISGDLPDGPAAFVTHRGQQLLVATDFGVFASATRNGGTWGLLGKVAGSAGAVPAAPIYHIVMRPGDDNELYASTFGRGIYRYRFDGTAPPVVKPPVAKPPTKPTKIPTTGLPYAVPAVATLLAAIGVLMARRRRRA